MARRRRRATAHLGHQRIGYGSTGNGVNPRTGRDQRSASRACGSSWWLSSTPSSSGRRSTPSVTVIATGFDSNRKAKAPNRYGAEAAGGIESSLDERSREILAEIERDRAGRARLEAVAGHAGSMKAATPRSAPASEVVSPG